MNSRYLNDRLRQLDDVYTTQISKLSRLRQDYSVATDTLIKFKLEKEIKETDNECKKISKEISEVEDQIKNLGAPNSIENLDTITLESNFSPNNGADYTLLEDLLRKGRWKQADEETLNVILSVANREQERWLRLEDFVKLRCQDLDTINYLWQKYSGGRFGLAVQGKIWKAVKVSAGEGKALIDFCRACGLVEQRSGVVSLFVKDKIMSIEKIYERLNGMNSSQISKNQTKGILPAIVHWSWLEDRKHEACLDALFSRIEDCEI
jgi:hypothetical protein